MVKTLTTLEPYPGTFTSDISLGLETIAQQLVNDRQVSENFYRHLLGFLHEAYGLMASLLEPDLECFVNAQSNNFRCQGKSEPNNIAGAVQLSPVQRRNGRIFTKVPNCRNLNFSLCRLLCDSGPFSESLTPFSRTMPKMSLERQLITLGKLPKFKEVLLVSYDLIIPQKYLNLRRLTQQTELAAEVAVNQTIEAAKYLNSQRHRLKNFTLVFACQGINARQYSRCVEEVLKYCRPGDVLGLGGWC